MLWRKQNKKEEEKIKMKESIVRDLKKAQASYLPI